MQIRTVRARIPGADCFLLRSRASLFYVAAFFMGSQVPTDTAVLQEKMYSRPHFLSKQKFPGRTLVMGNKYLFTRPLLS